MAITGNDFLVTPVKSFPYVMRPLNNITPFTYEDGTTYLEILTYLDKYIKDMGPDVDEKLKQLFDEFQAGITNAENTITNEIENWETLFNDFMADVVVRLEALNDQSVSNLLNDKNTFTGKTSRSLFAKEYYVPLMPGATVTNRALEAVRRAMLDGAGTVKFGPGAITITQPLVYSGPINFAGYGGTSGPTATRVTYAGPAGTAFITYDNSKVIEDWVNRISITDMVIYGDGGDMGVGATVDGISAITPDGVQYLNAAYMSIHRVFLRNLRNGIILDGYGHHVQESMAHNCLVGYNYAHPEQNMQLNSWASYCDIGVLVNDRKKPYGHKFHIIGGSYQRSRVGIHIMNFSQPTIDTYFELNTDNDILFGDPSDPGLYRDGVKGAEINSYFGSGVPNGANIKLLASEHTRIKFHSDGSQNTTKPHVSMNGYCKNTDIQYGVISSSAPWDIPMDATPRETTRIYPIGGSIATTIEPIAPYTDTVNRPVRKIRTPYGYVEFRGSLDTNTGEHALMFKLPVGFRPTTDKVVNVPMYISDTNLWSNAFVEIRLNGDVILANPGAGRRIYFDSVSFEPAQY